MNMGQHISYELEGVTYIGYLALPEGNDKAPGVLVCHEGPGISENTFTKADRLAALGFVGGLGCFVGTFSDHRQLFIRLRPRLLITKMTLYKHLFLFLFFFLIEFIWFVI